MERRALRSKALSVAALAAAGTGALALLRRRRHQRGDLRVYILEYHDVTGDSDESEGVISADRLRAHIRYLKSSLRFVSLATAMQALSHPGDLVGDVAVLSFDDGYAGNFESAWPVLRGEEVPGIVFVTTGFLDGGELWFDLARRGLQAARRALPAVPGEVSGALSSVFGQWPHGRSVDQEVEVLKYASTADRGRVLECLRASGLDLGPPSRPLTWDQVREMSKSGVEIGCHSVSHPILSLLSAELQEQEIRESARRIAEETGSRPTSFAIPNGSPRDFDATTLRLLEEQGFTATCTTVRGSNAPGCDPMRLRRIGVGSDSTAVLAMRLSGLLDARARVGIP